MESGRRRNREATEQRILAVTQELLERDGVLAGVNLQEVATRTQVNRALIYQYFGSRQGLLRAALKERAQRRGQEGHNHDYEPFAARRLRVFTDALRRTSEIQLAALLALDGTEDLGLFPILEEARAALTRDQTDGHLSESDDPEAMHVLTSAIYLGYAIFREEMARELDVPLEELDTRVIRAYQEWLNR